MAMPLAKLGDGEEYELGQVSERVYDPHHDAKIVDWRVVCFLRLGFNNLQATTLAMRRDVDRSEVERLRGRGCAPGSVLAIVL